MPATESATKSRLADLVGLGIIVFVLWIFGHSHLAKESVIVVKSQETRASKIREQKLLGNGFSA